MRGRPAGSLNKSTIAIVAPAKVVAKKVGTNVVLSAMPKMTKEAIVKGMEKARRKNETDEQLYKRFGITANDFKHYRFNSLPDSARQLVRNDVVMTAKNHVSQGIKVGSSAIAKMYGLSITPVIVWMEEEKQGIRKLRARGRPQGALNKSTLRQIAQNAQQKKIDRASARSAKNA